MKISKVFSLFLFGLLVSGIVQAQEAEVQVQALSVEPVMAMEMDMDMDSMHTMQEMDGDHEECIFSKSGKCSGNHAGCPMKNMMKSGYHGGSFFFGKLLHGLGCLLFLFFGAIVVRKGWDFKGCCKKSCKK